MAYNPKNVLTLSIAAADGDLIELVLKFSWQSWAAQERVAASRSALSTFASEIRAFAAHQRTEVRFEAGSLETGLLELVVAEYGRTRKAAFGAHLALAGDARGVLSWPTELRMQLPTEHGLLGEFGADLAQVVATDSGVAALRLLRHWPLA
jgi:hypothetical protein